MTPLRRMLPNYLILPIESGKTRSHSHRYLEQIERSFVNSGKKAAVETDVLPFGAKDSSLPKREEFGGLV
jgi:hypothetical protein